jgi:hypothetical protein
MEANMILLLLLLMMLAMPHDPEFLEVQNDVGPRFDVGFLDHDGFPTPVVLVAVLVKAFFDAFFEAFIILFFALAVDRRQLS